MTYHRYFSNLEDYGFKFETKFVKTGTRVDSQNGKIVFHIEGVIDESISASDLLNSLGVLNIGKSIRQDNDFTYLVTDEVPFQFMNYPFGKSVYDVTIDELLDSNGNLNIIIDIGNYKGKAHKRLDLRFIYGKLKNC